MTRGSPEARIVGGLLLALLDIDCIALGAASAATVVRGNLGLRRPGSNR